MSDVERTLREAFDSRARAAVADDAPLPAARFATPSAGRAASTARHRRGRVLAPLAAAAAVVAVVTSVLAVRGSPTGRPHTVAGAPTHAPIAVAASNAPRRGTGAPVRIEFGAADGARYGVGMPIVAYFSRRFTDAGPLADATSVSVGGRAARAAWYFELSSARAGFPVEGHLRLSGFWPARAQISVALATNGVSAGTGLVFAGGPRLTFTTGPRTIGVVNARTHLLSITRDGVAVGTYRVSLGAQKTPTSRGVKVIMEQRPSVCMRAADGAYNECGVKYAQRLTYSGEFLHAAPWNISHIDAGVDSSNGCTNLLPVDAERLYSTLEVGDIVEYPNADGPVMQLASGYGDWNVPWSTWLTGGLVPTHSR